METTRDFTVSVFIVNGDRVLLHFHKKLGIWLPVGGHIDKDELPDDALKREAMEESGLEIELFEPFTDLKARDVRELARPVLVILEDIEPGHQHIDLIYYATSGTRELNPQEGETSELKWFSRQDLEEEVIPENVKESGINALELLSKK